LNGILNLDNISLTDEQLEIIKFPPISLRLYPLSNTTPSTTSSDRVLIKPHTVIQLGLEINRHDIHNISELLFVNLVPCRLLSAVAFSWVNKINDIAVGLDNDTVPFIVCFHETGNYKLLAHCTDKKLGKDYWSPLLEVLVN